MVPNPFVIDLGTHDVNVHLVAYSPDLAAADLWGECGHIRLVGTRQALRNLSLHILRDLKALEEMDIGAPPPEEKAK
jgi:hypothetical protein